MTSCWEWLCCWHKARWSFSSSTCLYSHWCFYLVVISFLQQKPLFVMFKKTLFNWPSTFCIHTHIDCNHIMLKHLCPTPPTSSSASVKVNIYKNVTRLDVKYYLSVIFWVISQTNSNIFFRYLSLALPFPSEVNMSHRVNLLSHFLHTSCVSVKDQAFWKAPPGSCGSACGFVLKGRRKYSTWYHYIKVQ